MDETTFLWLKLFSLALISLAVFAAVSMLAWRDNVLLFRHYRSKFRQALTAWRAWRRARRDPEFRRWRDTVRRFEGPANLLLTLMANERYHFELSCGAEDGRSRDGHRREREKFRVAKLKAAPHVARRLAEFTADELLIVAQHLAGFDYDRTPAADDWRDGSLKTLAEMLKAQNRTLKSDPSRVIAELERLEKFCSENFGRG